METAAPRILVTGSQGQLGKAFRELSVRFPRWEWIFCSRQDMDLEDPQEIVRTMEKHRPAICLHTGAYTRVDQAESDADTCFRVNVGATSLLAKACALLGSHMVYFSSDYVYHGEQNTPHRESDACHPAGVYARSKYEGELAAAAATHRLTVIRTSWVYAREGHNFVNTMLRLGRERESLNVVFDQVGAPTYAQDLAMATCELLEAASSGKTSWSTICDTFNFCNAGVCSWYDFALEIFAQSGMAVQVHPLRSAAYPTPAQRPPYSVLDCGKIGHVLGKHPRHWKEALRECLQDSRQHLLSS